jgi:hypothetical protein
MIIKYKIITKDEANHSMVVRYFSDTHNEDFFAIDKFAGPIARNDDGSPVRCTTDYNFTMYQTPSLSGQALHDYIISVAPGDYLKLLDDIDNPEVDTNMTDIQTNIGKTFEVEYVEPEVVSPTSVAPTSVPSTTASKLETEAFMSEIDKLLAAIRTKD